MHRKVSAKLSAINDLSARRLIRMRHRLVGIDSRADVVATRISVLASCWAPPVAHCYIADTILSKSSMIDSFDNWPITYLFVHKKIGVLNPKGAIIPVYMGA